MRFNARSGSNGGEDGIRTHEGLLTLTPLAGERLKPLGHLSADEPIKIAGVFKTRDDIRGGITA